MPKGKFDNGEEFELDGDIAVGKLVDDFESAKELRRWCKTKVVLKLKKDGEGEYSTLAAVYTPELDAKIQAKYGDQLVEIINKRVA